MKKFKKLYLGYREMLQNEGIEVFEEIEEIQDYKVALERLIGELKNKLKNLKKKRKKISQDLETLNLSRLNAPFKSELMQENQEEYSENPHHHNSHLMGKKRDFLLSKLQKN